LCENGNANRDSNRREKAFENMSCHSNFAQIGVRSWTQEQINFLSDIVATGTLLKAEFLADDAPFCAGSEVQITFLVSESFKGTIPADGKLIVRQQIAQTEAWTGSAEAKFCEGDTYLLYLTSDIDGRFQPTSGPTQPEMSMRCVQRAQAEDSCRRSIASSYDCALSALA
jgi:hypothetical protein